MKVVLFMFKLIIYGILIPLIIWYLAIYFSDYILKNYTIFNSLRQIDLDYFSAVSLYFLFCVLYKILKPDKRKILVLIFVILIPIVKILPYITIIITYSYTKELVLMEYHIYLYLSFYVLFFITKRIYHYVNKWVIK